MFWGCVTFEGEGTLTAVDGIMNSRKYTEVLDSQFWRVIAKLPTNRGNILQEDNATAHTSRETTQWKRDNNIPTMNWPPQSPDLNIIENVWRILKIRLQTRVTRIHNRQELIDAVQEIWQSLTPMYIKSLYNSLP
jgi:transposase InsO family protein